LVASTLGIVLRHLIVQALLDLQLVTGSEAFAKSLEAKAAALKAAL
jgi:hypothetical protein